MVKSYVKMIIVVDFVVDDEDEEAGWEDLDSDDGWTEETVTDSEAAMTDDTTQVAYPWIAMLTFVLFLLGCRHLNNLKSIIGNYTLHNENKHF